MNNKQEAISKIFRDLLKVPVNRLPQALSEVGFNQAEIKDFIFEMNDLFLGSFSEQDQCDLCERPEVVVEKKFTKIIEAVISRNMDSVPRSNNPGNFKNVLFDVRQEFSE